MHVSFFPIRHLAEFKAFMLTTRILVIGFVAIEWDWLAAFLTFVVWSWSTMKIMDYTTDMLMAELKASMQSMMQEAMETEDEEPAGASEGDEG